MSDIQTYKNFVDVFQDISERHYQINTFKVGDQWEQDADTVLYPLLNINPTAADMLRSEQGSYATFEITFDCTVSDLVYKGEENETHVLSDNLQILQDIITEFNQHPYYTDSRFELAGDISFEPFTEQNDDEVSGWTAELVLRTPNIRSFCGLPVAEITGQSFPRPDSTTTIISVQYVTNILGDSPIIVTGSDSGQTQTISLDPSIQSDIIINTTAITNNSTSIINLDNDKYDKTGGLISGNVSFDNEGSVLTGGATSGFDLATGNVFINTLTGATEMDYTNATIGTYIFEFNGQTTSSVLTFATGKFQSVDGTTPILTATAGAVDSISGYYNGTTMILFTANNIIDLI